MRRQHFRFTALLMLPFAFLLLQCNDNQPDKTTSQEENQIKDLLQSYYQVMSDRDWPNYQLFFAEKATLTTIWQPEDASSPEIHTNTISEFLAQTGEGPDSQPIFEEKMTQAEIQVKGKLAQAWVDYEAKFGTEDQLMEWKGIDLFSFIKHQGEWKITALVFESE